MSEEILGNIRVNFQPSCQDLMKKQDTQMCGGLGLAVAVTGGVKFCKHLRFEVFEFCCYLSVGLAVCFVFVLVHRVASWCHCGGLVWSAVMVC